MAGHVHGSDKTSHPLLAGHFNRNEISPLVAAASGAKLTFAGRWSDQAKTCQGQHPTSPSLILQVAQTTNLVFLPENGIGQKTATHHSGNGLLFFSESRLGRIYIKPQDSKRVYVPPGTPGALRRTRNSPSILFYAATPPPVDKRRPGPTTAPLNRAPGL